MGDAKRRAALGLGGAEGALRLELADSQRAEDNLRRLLSLPEFGLAGEVMRTRAWLDEALQALERHPEDPVAVELVARYGGRLRGEAQGLQRLEAPAPPPPSPGPTAGG